ncbi:GIY-YIG nuclease family protein [candidate division WOR-3 bacterium]|uniref:GIY-YIG nuclease family protein n=1 Tax=candidate division WOR-3 bacterium TaxID=2052148 RepID=A0A937XJH7_UNCW3|nr:GIY-YIG nuclease family protein [candidate division WOR-3 bacterium]
MVTPKSPRLITGCLEGISKRVFADYSAQIAELAGEQSGIYALYNRGKLYYVGLATDLRRRIKHHLEDRHARNWDTFSLYVVRREAHLRDLEAMSIRIAKPKGNDIRGGRLTSLKPELKALIDEWNLRRTSRILGLLSDERRKPGSKRVSRQRLPVQDREFDTIVCPAHEDGFKEVFLRQSCWYAIRISKNVIPRLKYIAIYVTGKVKLVSHYGRIKTIDPWKRSGKYIVRLDGKPKEIGPIPWRRGVVIQSCRLTQMSKLKSASTLAGAF